jgi:hypothetical protein
MSVSPLSQDIRDEWEQTVVTPIKKVKPCNIATDLANASPIESSEQIMTKRMTRGRRRTRSPSGDMNTIPVA